MSEPQPYSFPVDICEHLIREIKGTFLLLGSNLRQTDVHSIDFDEIKVDESAIDHALDDLNVLEILEDPEEMEEARADILWKCWWHVRDMTVDGRNWSLYYKMGIGRFAPHFTQCLPDFNCVDEVLCAPNNEDWTGYLSFPMWNWGRPKLKLRRYIPLAPQN